MIRKLFRYANVLSIDVALGAVCSALFVGKYVGIQPRPYALIILFACVWLIYTTDHLLDAKKISLPASSFRHRFHQENFKTLRDTVLAVAALTLILSFSLPRDIFYAGVALSFFVGLYLLIQRWFSVIKEFTVAVLYSAGVFLPSCTNQVSTSEIFVFFVAFMLTAFLNLVIFSWFSYSQDRNDDMQSIVTRFGKSVTSLVIVVLWLGQGILMWSSGLDFANVVLFAMNTFWFAMFIFHQFFLKNERYRIGDAAFFLTLIHLLKS